MTSFISTVLVSLYSIIC